MSSVEMVIKRFVEEKKGSGTLLVRHTDLKETGEIHENGFATTRLSGTLTVHPNGEGLGKSLISGNQPSRVVMFLPQEANKPKKGKPLTIPREWIVGTHLIRHGRESFVPNHRFNPQHQE